MKKTTLLFLVFAGFFGAQNVNAAIVYNNGADQTLASGGTLTIDFNNDGTPEYTFQDMGFGGAVQPGIMFATANHHLTTVSTGEWDVLRGIMPDLPSMLLLVSSIWGMLTLIQAGQQQCSQQQIPIS